MRTCPASGVPPQLFQLRETCLVNSMGPMEHLKHFNSRIRFLVRLVLLSWLIVATLCNSNFSNAEEPYQKFLEKLRNEKLFDLALVYIDELKDQAGVSEQFKSEYTLERGLLLYNSAALMPPSNAQRPVKLDQAESAFRDFLKSQTEHQRRGEARLALGNLLLTRAEEAKRKAKSDGKQDVPEAIKYFGEGHQLFQDTITELAAILDKIKGAQIDSKDEAKVAYRNRLRGEYRQAQLFAASAIENRGRSRAQESPEWKKDLETSLSLYSDLYSKEKDILGIRMYALFYRSGVQVSLGKIDDGIDGYQRIADLEGIDSLRTLQIEAINELLPLLFKQGKQPVALERFDKWMSQLRPDEKNSSEVADLKVKFARLALPWAEELKSKNKDDKIAQKLLREIREMLQASMRVPGDHQEDARELLSEMGINSAESKIDDLPKVKDFAEALAAAQERQQRAEQESLGLAVLDNQIKSTTDADEKQKLTDQLAETKKNTSQLQDQAAQLLRIAIQKFAPGDSRDQLFEVRQRLAFAALKKDQPWEAIAVGEFLAQSNPGTPKGLTAGAIALAAYGELFKTANEDKKSELITQLQPFAEFLVSTWPQSDESAAAAGALVQLALINKEWDKADQFLKNLPEGNKTVLKLRRDAALTFYSLYLDEKRTATSDTPELQASRTRAFESLKKAAAGITKDNLGEGEIETLNALIRLHLMDNQISDAQTLLVGETSPINALKANPDVVAPRVAMDTFRTALQAEIVELADGKVELATATKRMEEYITQLEAAAKKDPEGAKTLAGIYVQLARDLKDMLATITEPAKRQKLAEALTIVTSNAGKKADEFNTKYWAADTLISVAEELSKQANSKEQAKGTYTAASSVLDDILKRGKENPDWMQPKGIDLNVKLLLARSLRGEGRFQDAINELADILKASSNMLEVQIEAARTYQIWGETDPRAIGAAMYGNRPNEKKVNLIWGWGKIATMVASNPNFSEQFFDARYQLAVCRYKHALSKTAEEKTKLLKQAAKDVESTATLYPNLGSPEQKKKFDSLLRAIQKDLGNEVTGLPKS